MTQPTIKEVAMSKLDLSKEKIAEILEAHKPKSLTEVYRLLGGTKLSGSTAKTIRTIVPGIEAVLGENSGKIAQAVVPVEPLKSKPAKKPMKNEPRNSSVPHDSRNPFRKWDSGYGLLLDLIANAGQKGIGKETLLAEYCRLTGKDLQHAKYDLAVISSAAETSERRHRSCADGFTILKETDNYRVRFDQATQ
jgi:hypothetical protein